MCHRCFGRRGQRIVQRLDTVRRVLGELELEGLRRLDVREMLGTQAADPSPGELNVQDDCSKQRQFECGHSYDEGALPEWPVPKYTCVMTCVMNDWLGQSLDLCMQVSRFGETRLVFERQRRGALDHACCTRRCLGHECTGKA